MDTQLNQLQVMSNKVRVVYVQIRDIVHTQKFSLLHRARMQQPSRRKTYIFTTARTSIYLLQ